MRRLSGASAPLLLVALTFAAVTTTVVARHSPAAAPTHVAPLPFDLVNGDVDPNGFPRNPIWTVQQGSPGSLADPNVCGGKPWTPACTNHATWVDNNPICAAFGLLGGHANWMPVTYDGTLFWNSHSAPGADDDYNIDLFRDDHAGLTEGSERSETLGKAPVLHMEFDSDETIDHFRTEWWKGFHKAVDAGKSHAQGVIDGRRGIVLGLLGMDYAHAGGTELHPVYAFAVETQGGLADNSWAIFVRNRGNEGFCASGNEELGATKITLLVPRDRASDVQVLADTFNFGPNDLSAAEKSQVSGPLVTLVRNEGALVTFTLPPASSGARINGSLHLKWRVSIPDSVLATRVTERVDPKTIVAREAAHGAKTTHGGAASEAQEPDRVVSQKIAALTPRQLRVYRAQMPAPSVQGDDGILHGRQLPPVSARPRPSQAPRARRVANPQRDALSAKKAAALKSAQSAPK